MAAARLKVNDIKNFCYITSESMSVFFRVEKWKSNAWENSKIKKGNNLKKMELYSKGVELVTGHGRFNKYFAKFLLKEVISLCCCGLEDDSEEHILSKCDLHLRKDIRLEKM